MEVKKDARGEEDNRLWRNEEDNSLWRNIEKLRTGEIPKEFNLRNFANQVKDTFLRYGIDLCKLRVKVEDTKKAERNFRDGINSALGQLDMYIFWLREMDVPFEQINQVENIYKNLEMLLKKIS